MRAQENFQLIVLNAANKSILSGDKAGAVHWSSTDSPANTCELRHTTSYLCLLPAYLEARLPVLLAYALHNPTALQHLTLCTSNTPYLYRTNR